MKFKFIFPLIVIVASLFVACEDASTSLGIEIQPVSDGILLDATTFPNYRSISCGTIRFKTGLFTRKIY